MSKKGKVWLIVIVSLLMLALAGAGYYIFLKQNEINTLIGDYDLQKEELENEYADLAVQYEGAKFQVNNDSLIQQLESERVKVQRIQEELRTVKSTNLARINELKKELATLRAVMRNYIIQIDSLNSLNKKLTVENESVTRKYVEVSQTATQLKKEKEQLHEQVTLASKLDAVGITVTPVDKRGKVAKKIDKTEQLKVCFSIAKNVTAPIGEKYIYMRIMKPDNDVLVKNRADVFRYEDRDINYSSRIMIEYEGEEMNRCIYWQVEEYLSPGEYRVDLFADNYRIGSRTFTLNK